MQPSPEIIRAHIERMRKGYRAGQWLMPVMFGLSALVHRHEGIPPAVFMTAGAVWLLVLLSNVVIKPGTAYRRVLAYAVLLAIGGFACVFAAVGSTGGVLSPYTASFALAVVGSAFLLPLTPLGILLMYPTATLGFAVTVLLFSPADAPREAIYHVINTAFWAAFISGLGAWFHYRTLQDAFSWRSALREEARRADLGLERARIARDLHDHIGARLTGIALRAEREQRRLTAEAHPALAWIQETVRLCLEELRDTIWALSNSGRDARELVATLRRRAEDIADAAGLELAWDIEDKVWNGTLSPGVSVALSAILREALTNTIRHSGARHVTVAMERQEKIIRMLVSDDGRGLGDNPNEGRGLNNMRARAKEQHGDVYIEQNGERGLRVVAEIPWREDLLQDQKAA